MLFVKILGAALIIFSGFLSGRYMSQKLKRRCDILESIIWATCFVKEQIICFRYEIGVIYKNLLESGFDKNLLKFLTDKSSHDGFADFDCLTQRDKKLAKELFDNIGMSDIKGEEERILVYIKLLSEELEAAKEDFLKKEKLYKNVGAFLGVGIAIFFI